MRKAFGLVLALFLPIFILSGCGKTTDIAEEVLEEDTIEAILDDEVEDYNFLNVNQLELLAYEGDLDAQYQLGVTYEYGQLGQQQNFDKAIEWYTMAASSDNKDAVCALGYFYLTGSGVDKNLEIAREYFERAISLGSVNAYTGLGRTYLVEYESIDMPQELELLETQDAPVSYNLPNQSVDEINALASNARKNIEKALIWGDLDATYYMGYIYEKGIGCSVNLKTAAGYYKTAAAKESKLITDQFAINEACVSLGLMYVDGYDPETGLEGATEYFGKASDNGSAKAMFFMGQLYENGLGVDKDYEEAMRYYKLAADADYAPALNQVGYLYYNGYGVDCDFESAVYYQKLAAMQGYAPAQVNLGYMYEYGYGVECNLQTACAYYQLAADAGLEGAYDAVARVKAQINEED